MRKGRLVFAQLTAHLPREVFLTCADRYAGNYPTLTFSYWDQFLCMVFAQLTCRTSLRDITTCLRSQSPKLYLAGFRGSIARSTLADANERRDSRTFEAFAMHLIGMARTLYRSDSLAVQLEQTVYAIDASTIDLCLSLFSWTPAANERAGVKLNTLLDLRGNIPSVIDITSTLHADVFFLDRLRLEPGSFYVMDRGYLHFARLIKFTRAGAFFVIRGKRKIAYRVERTHDVDASSGVLLDETIALSARHSARGYPDHLRRIEFKEPVHGRVLVFLTNNFDLNASTIAHLYKCRWQVELFFKWIKQHLRIQAFVGYSANAVRTQIWTAISTYLMVAIVKKRLNVSASMHSLMQILSLNLFENVPLQDLFAQATKYEESPEESPQLKLL